ncbi:MAG: hypothetical protein SFX18_17100 [Pirellulales bacterium]|nr:hypothetical protein [Pirellulales bacterium]
MSTGNYPNEDDLLRQALSAWEEFSLCTTQSTQEDEDTIQAIHEGIADMEASRMRPLDDLLAEARKSA